MELARELLHGPEDHRAKGLIMEPIAVFMEMVETRTASEVAALRAKARTYERVGLGLMGLAVSLLVICFVQLQRRIARPVGELAVAAGRATGALPSWLRPGKQPTVPMRRRARSWPT